MNLSLTKYLIAILNSLRIMKLHLKRLKIIKMKKLFYFIIVVVVATSCATSAGNGELIGVLGRPVWYQTDPYGMLYIPAGAFNMGQSDQDVPQSHYNETKTVSVGAFYMDQTEITNNEYRQFDSFESTQI